MADGKCCALATCVKTVSVMALGSLLGGCSSEDAMGPIGAGEESGATASVEVALATVPTSTQCIRLTTTPTTGAAIVNNFTVTAGSSSASLTIGKLAAGNYTVSGEAFNASCNNVSGIGDWIADPVPATMQRGVTTSVTLTFRKSNPLKATANFVNNVLNVSLGNSTTYVVTDGGLLTSGWQPGTGSTPTFVRRAFTMFDGTATPGNTITSFASSFSAFCAARADGTVWCWGTNNYGELGSIVPLGGSTATPTQFAGLTNVRQLSAGYGQMCAVTTADIVSCWGRNDHGQLGNGTTINATTPQALGGAVKSVTCGTDATYLVRADGTVSAFGYNGTGQLGDGTTTDRLSPVPVTGEVPVQAVAAGRYHACSLRVDNSVRCWGSNVNGQLGNGTTTSSPTPVLVSGFTARQISAGYTHTCAIDKNGYPYCWGDNSDGLLGDASVTDATYPSRVGGTVGGVVGGPTNNIQFTSLATGSMAAHQCGISVSTDLWCWGANNYGQLGEGTTVDPFLPVKPLLQ